MVTIRTAVADDVEVLAHIAAASFVAAYGANSDAADTAEHIETHFSIAAIAHEMSLANQEYLLALVDGEAAGFAKLRERGGPDCVPEPRAVELQQLYVAPDLQRFGVGAKLIEAVLKWVQDCSLPGVWLSVWERADWATSFYRKVGFEALGEAEFRVGKTCYRDLIMYRPASV